MKLVLSHN